MTFKARALRIAVVGGVITASTWFFEYRDYCTTTCRGLPLPFFCNNCECENPGPEWFPGTALADWVLMTLVVWGAAAVFVPRKSIRPMA